MKIVLLVALLALAMATKVTEKDGKIDFELDTHKDSPFGFYLKGNVDPRDDSKKEISAFLKLANEYIPLLKTMMEKESILKIDRVWNFEFLGVVLEVYGHFDLVVGWTVNPGTAALNFFEVTYTPYIWGAAFGRLNGTTWPIEGFTRGGIEFIHAYAPIALTLFREGRVCFDAFYVVDPVHIGNQFGVSLRGCQAEIIDELLTQTPLYFTCDFNEPIDVQFIDYNVTNLMSDVIIGQTCIG